VKHKRGTVEHFKKIDNLRFLIRRSVDFWYLRISRRATVPGRYLWGFLTPPVAGADLRAALVASCLRGALPPVDLRAVCLVRAMVVVVCDVDLQSR
jgi:hypothetical protein